MEQLIRARSTSRDSPIH